jgi:glycerate kinase
MKTILAFDKFKGSLGAAQACQLVWDALRAAHPGWQIVVKPMADGGEGTAEALVDSLGGEWRTAQVSGPLPGLRVTARYGWLARDRTAIIEMAQASGLAWLKPTQRNPLQTTTRGTGELIADAIQRGARRVWLAVGGSATVDGGVGAAMALGWRFLDAQDQLIGPGGGELERIARIEPPPAADQESPIAVTVLCDVDNPLCGPQGAARVFGPQKGASPAMVDRLDAGLRHLADVVKGQLGNDIADVPRAGAAGGLAAGALAFLNAQLVSGAETVMSASGLARELAEADWVITGEGRFDEQSLRGKVVAGVAALARRHGVKVAVIAGSVDLAEETWRSAGITIVAALKDGGVTLDYAMEHAGTLLVEKARSLFRQ